MVRQAVARVVDRVVEDMSVVVYAVTIVVMFCQVVMRYGFNSPFPWAEELSRDCFVWIVYLGAAIAAKRGTHLSVDYLAPYLPSSTRRAIARIFLWTCILFLLVIAFEGSRLSIGFVAAPSYTMKWLPQGAVYAVIPIGAVLTAINMWRNRDRGVGTAGGDRIP